MMRLFLLYFFLLAIAVTSCRRSTLAYKKEDLQGVWMIDFDSYVPSISKSTGKYPRGYDLGFELIGDSICHYQYGFYRYIDSLKEDCNLEYLGNKTRYKVLQDTLMIWNLATISWDSYHIKNLTSDTLKLYDPLYYKRGHGFDSVITFVRKSSIQHQDFDAVLVTRMIFSDPSHCPDRFVYMRADGKMMFWKKSFDEAHQVNRIHDFASLSIDPKNKDSLLNNFNYMDLDSIQSEYKSLWVGYNKIHTIVFLKNGKVVKTVLDIDETSPDELKWGYIPLMLSSFNLQHRILDNGRFAREYMDLTNMVDSVISNSLKFDAVLPPVLN